METWRLYYASSCPTKALNAISVYTFQDLALAIPLNAYFQILSNFIVYAGKYHANRLSVVPFSAGLVTKLMYHLFVPQHVSIKITHVLLCNWSSDHNMSDEFTSTKLGLKEIQNVIQSSAENQACLKKRYR